MKGLSYAFIFLFALTGFIEKINAQVDILKTAEVIENPERYSNYSAANRKFTGISSMAITEDGTFYATWYAGVTPAEDHNNYVIVASSNDQGKSWSEILVIDPDKGKSLRTFDPELWVDPTGKLWVFWAQGVSKKAHIEYDGKIAGVWAITSSNPDADNPDWTSPERITDGIMMCKPTVLSNGEWFLPVSTWMATSESAKSVVSTDQGKSWKVRGGAHVPKDIRTFDEHMIVEKNDKSLWLLARTKYGIGESFSKDKGKTWTELSPTSIKHPSARFFISRLNSGNLLLVKHGSIDMRIGRSHMMAFISKDDGKTWSKGLLLDERAGVSYPDGQQLANGEIYITYDYDRYNQQKVYMTSFTEEDVLSENYDDSMIKVFQNRREISDGGDID